MSGIKRTRGGVHASYQSKKVLAKKAAPESEVLETGSQSVWSAAMRVLVGE